MNKETQLLTPENLPLDLGELGVVTEADLVMPGVYDVILERPETGVAAEGFIVLGSAIDISELGCAYEGCLSLSPRICHPAQSGGTGWVERRLWGIPTYDRPGSGASQLTRTASLPDHPGRDTVYRLLTECRQLL